MLKFGNAPAKTKPANAASKCSTVPTRIPLAPKVVASAVSTTSGGRRAMRRSPLCSADVEAAFFDLDKTVIAKASMLAFGRPLLDAGMIVAAIGGGVIPVVADEYGHLHGVAAVIDKDFASSLLATDLGADTFIISTAVEKVAINFGKPDQKWLDQVTLAEAKAYLAEGTHFAKGSMAPKIQAIINFLEGGGQHAIVTDPASIPQALAGKTGTHFIQ